VLLGVAALYVAAFVGAGVLRAVFPFQLDGLEPGALREMRRILVGEPVYVRPGLDYVPYIYGPAYFYASALVALLTGPNYVALRLVSLGASIASIALVALIVRRETRSLAAGLVGGGLLAACAPLADHAWDVARMDALSLAFMLGAIYAARVAVLETDSPWRSSLWAGLLAGLAVLTKQSGIPILLALLLALGLTRPRMVPGFVLAAGITIAVPLGLLTAQSGPWPMFYIWELPRRHDISLDLIPRFWNDMLGRFTLPIVVAPLYFVGRIMRRDRRGLWFYGIVSLAMLGTAWASRSNVGGALNVELPAYGILSLLFGLGLHEALVQLGSSSSRARVFRSYVIGAAIMQFALMLYNPRLMVPYRSDAWAGERLAATLASLPGPIFAGSFTSYVPESPGYVQPELGAVYEVLGGYGGNGTPEGNDWLAEYRAALADKRFTHIVVDPDVSQFFVADMAREMGYIDQGQLFGPSNEYWLWRTAGWVPKPRLLTRPDLVTPAAS
jgi:hypothetical protein